MSSSGCASGGTGLALKPAPRTPPEICTLPPSQANREAPTLLFTSARGEVPRINTTAAIVAKHVAEPGLEEEVAALLEAAGAASAKAVQEAEDALSIKVIA